MVWFVDVDVAAVFRWGVLDVVLVLGVLDEWHVVVMGFVVVVVEVGLEESVEQQHFSNEHGHQ